MNYETIQKIAYGVINSSAACDGQLFTGTVSSASPLAISLGNDAGGITLDGDDIILTQSVVSKKIYIKKHTHKIGTAVGTHTHGIEGVIVTTPEEAPPPIPPLTPIGTAKGNTLVPNEINAMTEIVDRTLDAWCTEYGHKLPVDPDVYNPDGEQICITINRGLEVGDKVIMSRVSDGQQFVVLSRYFEVDNPGKDDD
jgi:hypothetical protein